MKKKILVVEDDAALARVLRDNFEFDGFDVECAADGNDAIRRAREFAPDLVILDVMLPGRDGFELVGLLRRGGQTPVIMLTARSAKADKLRGLDLGADDYVTKPFDLEELLARVRAVLRRASPGVERVALGDVVIDFKAMQATRGREVLHLTHRELELLRYLAERQARVVHRDELLREVWGYPAMPATRSVDHAVARLRKKIEPDARPSPLHPHRARRRVPADAVSVAAAPASWPGVEAVPRTVARLLPAKHCDNLRQSAGRPRSYTRATPVGRVTHLEGDSHAQRPVLVPRGVMALTATTAFAQGNPTGAISGQVTDPDGLALPGVVVTATSPGAAGGAQRHHVGQRRFHHPVPGARRLHGRVRTPGLRDAQGAGARRDGRDHPAEGEDDDRRGDRDGERDGDGHRDGADGHRGQHLHVGDRSRRCRWDGRSTPTRCLLRA